MTASIARTGGGRKPQNDADLILFSRGINLWFTVRAAVRARQGLKDRRCAASSKDRASMKRWLVTIALGAAMLSTQALAQDGAGEHGRAMQDMTRAQAEQRADMMVQRFDLNDG